MKKRLTAMLMALALLVSLMPMGALAVDGQGDGRTDYTYDDADTAQAATGVTATKTLSGPDANGNYTITLSVKGFTDQSSGTEYSAADVVLVMDRSGSMDYEIGSYGNRVQCGSTSFTIIRNNWYQCDECGAVYRNQPNSCTHDLTRMDVAKRAAKQFVTGLLSIEGADIRIALCSFANNGRTDQGLTKNALQLTDAIDGLPSDGGTNYSRGLNEAQSALQNSGNRQKFVIFLSDGEPTGGNNGVNAAGTLRNSGVTIYTVGIDIGNNDYSARNALAAVSSGGDYQFYASTSGDSGDALDSILNTISKEIQDTIYAGTNAEMTDVINIEDFNVIDTPFGDDVTYSNGTITWNIGNIGSTTESITFTVKPKEGKYGTLYTNKDVSLTFNSSMLDGEKVTFEKGAIGDPTVTIEAPLSAAPTNELEVRVVVDSVEYTGSSINSYITVEAHPNSAPTYTGTPEYNVTNWNSGNYSNGFVTYSYTNYDCKDIYIKVNGNNYILEGINAQLVAGISGCEGIVPQTSGEYEGSYKVDNVDGDSVVYVYLRTPYTVNFYGTDDTSTVQSTGNLIAGASNALAGQTSTSPSAVETPKLDDYYNGNPDDPYVETDDPTDNPATASGKQPATDFYYIAGLSTSVTVPQLPSVTGSAVDGWFLENVSSDKLDPSTEENYNVTAEDDADGNHIINFYCNSTSTDYTVTYQWSGFPADAQNLPELPAVGSHHYNDSVTVSTSYTADTSTVTIGNDIYTFQGWSSQDVTISEGRFTMPASSVTIVGTWTKTGTNPTVTYTVNGDEPGSFTPPIPETVYYAPGTSVQVADNLESEETSNNGVPGTWEFSGWTTESSGVNISDGSFTMPENDVVFTGSWKFTPNTYTVTVNVINGTASATGIGEPVVSGDTNTYTLTVGYGQDSPLISFAPVTDGENNYTLDYVTVDGQPYTFNGDHQYTFKDVVANGREITVAYSLDNWNDEDDEETGGDGIPDKYQKEVTFKVVNGAWNDETTADKVIYVTLRDAEGNPSTSGTYVVTEDDVPAVGDKPGEGRAPHGYWRQTSGMQGDPVGTTIRPTSTAEFTFYYLPPVTLTITVEDRVETYTGEELHGYGNNVTAVMKATGLEVDVAENADPDHVTVSNWSSGGGYAGQVGPMIDGDIVTLTYTPASGTEPGTHDNAVANWTVTRDGVDVSNLYEITVVKGKLTINKSSMTVDKSATVKDDNGNDIAVTDDTTVDAGDEITYTITVTNTGNVNLSGVSVTDSMWGTRVNSITVNGAPETLSADNDYAYVIETLPATTGNNVVTIEYTLTVAETDAEAGKLSNTAKAATEDGTEDDGTIEIPVNNPGIDVDKALTGASRDGVALTVGEDFTAQPGDVLTYTITVTNTGNTTFDRVVVSDEMWQNGKVKQITIEIGGQEYQANVDSGSWTIAAWNSSKTSFAPNETWTCTYTYTVNEDDVEGISNTATVTTTDGGPSDKTTTYTDVFNADMNVDKELTLVNGQPYEGGAVRPGDTLTYSITVTNTGEDTITSFTVSDSLWGEDKVETIDIGAAQADVTGGSYPFGGTLYAGNTWICTYSYTVPEDVTSVTNSATATVPGGPEDKDEITTPVEEPEPEPVPGLTVTKTASDTTPAVGQTVTYTVVISNTGDTKLDVTVTDSMMNGSVTATWNGDAGTARTYSGVDGVFTVNGLDAGEYVTLTYTYTVARSDAGRTIVNTLSYSTDGGPSGKVTETIKADPLTPVIPDPDPIEPDIDYVPNWLNTEDHFAYIVGYEDGEVKPGNNITRAEVATIFFRLLTDDARAMFWSQTNDYTDVAADAWYNNAVSTLSNMGIINGYSDGSFKPNAPITRAEFTAIATRFFDYTAAYRGAFSDVSYSAWYAASVQAAVDMGLVDGYPDGSFRPDNYITRAEAVTIVNRVLGRLPHEDHLLDEDEMITWPDNLYGAWYYADMQEATNSHDYDWIRVSGEVVEDWTAKLAERNWEALEQEWSTAYSG